MKTSAPALASLRVDGVDLHLDQEALARGVLVAFTGRRGGISEPPYDSLNLALRVGDEAEAVHENRARAARAVGYDERDLALARQVHGASLLRVDRGSDGVVGEADGLVASAPGVVLGVLTADCVPVAIEGEGAIALVHAGWRGLVAGVIEEGVGAVAGPRAAWIGPSIHACCYEVGLEVVAAFAERGLPVTDDSHVDPGFAAAFALRRAGIDAIASVDECTSCGDGYFSYRRDGVTGRQGAFAGLVAR